MAKTGPKLDHQGGVPKSSSQEISLEERAQTEAILLISGGRTISDISDKVVRKAVIKLLFGILEHAEPVSAVATKPALTFTPEPASPLASASTTVPAKEVISQKTPEALWALAAGKLAKEREKFKSGENPPAEFDLFTKIISKMAEKEGWTVSTIAKGTIIILTRKHQRYAFPPILHLTTLVIERWFDVINKPKSVMSQKPLKLVRAAKIANYAQHMDEHTVPGPNDKRGLIEFEKDPGQI